MFLSEGFFAIAQGPLFWLPVTLGLYAGATAAYRRAGKSSLLNPTLLTIAGVGVLLLALRTPHEAYFQSVAAIHYLLGTAVVALAVPLYNNLDRLRGRCLTMALALAAGSLASILVGVAVAVSVKASALTILSLAPKSATAAVSMEIARTIGGVPAITGVLTILTGITGAVFGPYVLDVAGIDSPEARGFALGVTSHGIATARAFSESDVAGSFAGLGMTLNAVLTALVVPIFVRIVGL